jgi:hypothetical protein
VLGAMLVPRTRRSQREQPARGHTRIISLRQFGKASRLLGTGEHLCGKMATRHYDYLRLGETAVNASVLDHYKQLLLAKRRDLLPATAGALANAEAVDERPGGSHGLGD